MSSDYALREVDPFEDDECAEQLRALHALTLPSDEVPPFDDGSFWWFAYHNDDAVAFAGLRASRNWTGTAYLSRSGVLPEHRGQGLQRRLIRAREAKARKLGWTWALCDTRDNAPSSNNLIRCGYRLYTPATPYGYGDTLYWRRKLIIQGHDGLSRKDSGSTAAE